MLGLHLAPALEHKTPREGGDIAVNLGIEKIPEPDEGRGKGHGNAQVVKNPHKVEIVLRTVFPGEPHHAEEQHDGPPMACKATFPDLEYFQETIP